MTATINSRALLVNLSISQWSARKFDKAISEEIAAQHRAARDVVRANKALIQGDSYKALCATMSIARKVHYFHTLAWSDDGYRLLPTANHAAYTDELRSMQAKFQTALAEFVRDYPRLQEIARSRLNGMYKAADYPHPAAIADRFSMSTEFTPIPAAGDFRLDELTELTADELQRVEQSVTSRVERATADAVGDAWQRLHEVVSAMRERLAQPNAVFRDTLVTNARDVVEVLGRLNVTQDPSLEAMRATVASDLTQYDPQELRDTPAIREQTAARADEILTALQGAF